MISIKDDYIYNTRLTQKYNNEFLGELLHFY